MHQIRQKKPKLSKRNATSSLIAPTSSARPTSALVNRAARSSIAHRRSSAIWALSSLSLWSGLSLLSLSLSLSLSQEVIWSENEGRDWFPGQRWKYWSTGSHFSENDIFCDSETCGKGWKWFPEIIFTQNKRTLKYILQGKIFYQEKKSHVRGTLWEPESTATSLTKSCLCFSLGLAIFWNKCLRNGLMKNI